MSADLTFAGSTRHITTTLANVAASRSLPDTPNETHVPAPGEARCDKVGHPVRSDLTTPRAAWLA